MLLRESGIDFCILFFENLSAVLSLFYSTIVPNNVVLNVLVRDRLHAFGIFEVPCCSLNQSIG